MAHMMRNFIGNNISKVPESPPFRGQNSKWQPKILKFANDSEKAGVNYFTQPVKIHFCCICSTATIMNIVSSTAVHLGVKKSPKLGQLGSFLFIF